MSDTDIQLEAAVALLTEQRARLSALVEKVDAILEIMKSSAVNEGLIIKHLKEIENAIHENNPNKVFQ